MSFAAFAACGLLPLALWTAAPLFTAPEDAQQAFAENAIAPADDAAPEPPLEPIAESLPEIPATPPTAPTSPLPPPVRMVDLLPSEHHVPSSPEPKEHPLGEWYEAGRHQGKEASRSFRDLAISTPPERRQLTQLLQNLSVDISSLPMEQFNICFEGYKHGFEGASAMYRTPENQVDSLLPPELRNPDRFPEPEEQSTGSQANTN